MAATASAGLTPIPSAGITATVAIPTVYSA
jgi:hypothetical protein